MGKNYHNYSKVAKAPRRPFEKERLDRELKLVGDYGEWHHGALVVLSVLELVGYVSQCGMRSPGLRNKREVWRVNFTLAKMRSVARTLLTLPAKVVVVMFTHDVLVALFVWRFV